MSRRLAVAAAVLAVLLPGRATGAAATTSTPMQVWADGAVHHAGGLELPQGARFADAVLAAMPRRDAYAAGASVFREQLRAAQVRERAGLLHDLQAVAGDVDAPPVLASRARMLHRWIDSLPASGREPIEGDARRLEAGRGDSNRLLANGDRFYFPERPSTVNVVGAVLQSCALPHVPARDAVDYLAGCPVEAATAQPDILYVIQPDGAIQELGIATWNRSPPQALAPGAIIYVPLRNKAVEASAPELNAAMTRFLATLHLPHAWQVGP